MNPRAIDVGIVLAVALTALLGAVVLLDEAHGYGWLEILGTLAILGAVALVGAHSVNRLLEGWDQ